MTEKKASDDLMYLAVLVDRTKDRTISDDARVQACLDFLDAIDALANDSLADVEERKIALELQVKVSEHIYLRSADLIAALLITINSETADSKEREQARNGLKRLADHMKERGTDISQWVESGSKRLQ